MSPTDAGRRQLLNATGRTLLLPLALAVPLQAQSGNAAPHATADRIAKIEAPRQPGSSDDAGKTLAELMTTHGIPALSLAVVEDYRLAWAKAYGVRAASSGARADTDTLFQAASISKPVSTMAVLPGKSPRRLGRARLDDPIRPGQVPDRSTALP